MMTDVNECEPINPCAHVCVDKPVGYECRCNAGFQANAKDKHLCSDVDECSKTTQTRRPCSQVCHNSFGSYSCSCAAGYAPSHNGRSCKIESDVAPVLLFTNRYYIRQVAIHQDNRSVASMRVQNLTNAVALDYDWHEQCLYWSDVTEYGSSLKRVCGNATTQDHHQTLHSSTLQNPDGSHSKFHSIRRILLKVR